MKKITALLIIIILLNIPMNVQAKEKFIIDTDFSSDVDDAIAISTAMWFQDNNLADIRGVALCTTSARGCWAMSALLGQHGYWNIPICNDWDDGIVIGSKYHLGITNNYPYKEAHFTDTVNFYRMLLASSEEPVNIITLGQTVNIARLLDSEPDIHSPLTGYELVQQKVDTLYILGCKDSGKPENNMWYCGENYGNNRWYGTCGVAESGMHIANDFPARVVWMTAELGGFFQVGQFFNKTDKMRTDIITNAMYDFGNINGVTSFDPMGVYVAMMDANGLLEEKGMFLVNGTMRVYADGSSSFADCEATRNHYRVVKAFPDCYYQSEINKMLGYEYTKRTGKEIVW